MTIGKRQLCWLGSIGLAAMIATGATIWTHRGPHVFGMGKDVESNEKLTGLEKERTTELYNNLALLFEANQGQADPEVQFLSQGRGYRLLLTSSEAALSLYRTPVDDQGRDPISELLKRAHEKPRIEQTTLRMKLTGGHPAPSVSGLEPQRAKSNYFIGNDPEKWHQDIPNYARVRYQAVYLGIDMVYYGYQHQIEYDFIVKPGADLKQVRLTFEGAKTVELDAQGDLYLQTDLGEMLQKKPQIYQEVKGQRIEIAGAYQLLPLAVGGGEGTKDLATTVSFQVAAYDPALPLVIDPLVISYFSLV
jgi:hypothetical protein